MGGSLTRGYCELGPGPVELGPFLREAQSLPVPRSHRLHRLELAEQHRRVAPPGDEQGDWAPESLGGAASRRSVRLMRIGRCPQMSTVQTMTNKELFKRFLGGATGAQALKEVCEATSGLPRSTHCGRGFDRGGHQGRQQERGYRDALR